MFLSFPLLKYVPPDCLPQSGVTIAPLGSHSSGLDIPRWHPLMDEHLRLGGTLLSRGLPMHKGAPCRSVRGSAGSPRDLRPMRLPSI